MVIALLKISVPLEKHKDALQLVRSILGWTRVQAGCKSIAFYQDTDESDTMILIEEWEEWSNLDEHIRSDSFRNILELIDLSSIYPEIKLNTISKTEGMERIEAVRAKDFGF